MPNRRWELVLIDPTGQRLARALDLSAADAERIAAEFNATQVPTRRGEWFARPKEANAWNCR